MYYEFSVTPPTNIESVATYRQRMREIIYGQMKNVFAKGRFISPFFWLFCIVFIPLSLVYLFGCIMEIFVDTLLFPLSLIPVVRVIPTAVRIAVWSLTVAVGCFSCVDMVYMVGENKVANEGNDKPLPIE